MCSQAKCTQCLIEFKRNTTRGSICNSCRKYNWKKAHEKKDSSSLSSKRFKSLVDAASEASQVEEDYSLAMNICTPTPLATRSSPFSEKQIVQEQSLQFRNVITDVAARLNQEIRIISHRVKLKQKKIDDYFRQEKALER